MEIEKEEIQVKEEGFKEKSSKFFKKFSSDIQKGAKDIVDKAKVDIQAQRLKKYNPVFPEQFNSAEFCLPNMIEIVDDAVRRGIDVCEGSIGWISKEGGMEVLHLYDEWVKDSEIQFVPTATCDTVYYVDQFNRNKFTRVDCIFGKAHEERLAELERVAYLLGAKTCSIEIVEEFTETVSMNRQYEKADQGAYKKVEVKQSEEYEKRLQNSTSAKISGRTISRFEGSDNPVRPELKWFANDDNVKGLIEMRCTACNSIKTRTLILEGASSATMSQKTACAIDSAVMKMKSKTSFDMENQAKKEHRSKLVYELEF